MSTTQGGRCPCGKYARARNCPACKGLVLATTPDSDRQRMKLAQELASTNRKYADALGQIERLEKERGAWGLFDGVAPVVIEARAGSGTSEATAVVVASDWHYEEQVVPATVSGLNEFNLTIAEQRAQKFFTASVRLVKLLQQDVNIHTLILALLGDFFSGDIHEEVEEMCQVPPMEAVILVLNQLTGGIDFILNHTNLTLVVPCHSGNHARTTKTTRFGAENGHSLEYLMYHFLQAHYRNEPRVVFQVAPGMHSYVQVYDQTVRFQHGHAVKYNGGVGGIYIPVNKAIGQWNKGKHADLDVFGHFHQLRDGGNFICNGSLIGYNTFALSIKADYEPPKQTLFLIDKKRGRTCTWPILFK